MKPVPILFTIPNFITAGSGRALWHVATRLDRRRFAPHVAIERAGGKLEAEFEAAGIPVHVLPFTVGGPRRRMPARAWKAAQPFRRFGFRLWHSYHYGDDYSEGLVAGLAGARWIYTKKNMSWGSNAWKVRTALATGIAVQNREMLERFFGAPWMQRRARLVERGVDATRFAPGVPARLGVRAARAIPEGAVVATTVAQIIPRKGLEALLQAVARVPALHLVIAGPRMDEAYAQKIEALRDELGLGARVHLLGPVADVPALLAESDVFTLVSRAEGSPVALLEAMACGVPCIAARVAGSIDIVREGQDGLLVAVDDVPAIASALAELAGSKERRRALGAAARRRVEERYTIAREVRDHEALYDEVLARRWRF